MSKRPSAAPGIIPSIGGWIGVLFLNTCVMASAFCAPAADKGGQVMVQFAPGTVHYRSSEDYADSSTWLVGAEYQRSDRYLAGYAYFNNSFGQKSHYIYGGRSWAFGVEDRSFWYLKLTGGLIIGYRDPYQDKLPFNHNGVAPAIIPGLGYQFDRFNAQANVLGAAGLMFTFGYDLFR
jgi:hypothetical protein